MAGQAYTLALHFAELYFDKSGNRVFTVIVNGNAALTDYDIVADAGALQRPGYHHRMILTVCITDTIPSETRLSFIYSLLHFRDLLGGT